ncbi:hypothetical protein D3C76_1294970 [compost metagenome]
MRHRRQELRFIVGSLSQLLGPVFQSDLGFMKLVGLFAKQLVGVFQLQVLSRSKLEVAKDQGKPQAEQNAHRQRDRHDIKQVAPHRYHSEKGDIQAVYPIHDQDRNDAFEGNVMPGAPHPEVQAGTNKSEQRQV